MGGSSSKETTNTSSLFDQLQAASQSGSQSQAQSQSQTQATTPWANTQGLLGGILGQLGGVSSALTGAETDALNRWAGIGAAGNPFAPAISGVANTLLAGGGPDRTGIAASAYDEYRRLLSPTASGAYTDPTTNPFFAQTAQTIGNDVENRVKAMYAGAGRDPVGAGNYGYNLARGISEGTAPIYSDIYNRERQNQLAAAGNLYGAGNTTTGVLSGLDQTALANKQAGIGAAGSAVDAQMWGPMQVLQAEAARRGIPLDTLARQMGLTLPAAQAFATTSSTGQSAGTGQSMSQGSTQTSGTSTGTKTTDKETPFNPWSLAPLAFAPFTGGTSLAGMGASALGGGLFGSLTNGFMGPGSWRP